MHVRHAAEAKRRMRFNPSAATPANRHRAVIAVTTGRVRLAIRRNDMRCFIPGTDDELYAFIERFGVEALVPYRVGLPAARTADVKAPPSLAGMTGASVLEEPRLAA